MEKFKYERTTNKDFETIINLIKEELSKHQFGALFQLNFKDKFDEKGIDFNQNFVVLEVCNPVKAANILEKRLDVGYFLPCKMAIYEEENEVKVGFIRPSMLIEAFEDEELKQIANEVEEILVTTVNNVI